MNPEFSKNKNCSVMWTQISALFLVAIFSLIGFGFSTNSLVREEASSLFESEFSATELAGPNQAARQLSAFKHYAGTIPRQTNSHLSLIKTNEFNQKLQRRIMACPVLPVSVNSYYLPDSFDTRGSPV